MGGEESGPCDDQDIQELLNEMKKSSLPVPTMGVFHGKLVELAQGAMFSEDPVVQGPGHKLLVAVVEAMELGKKNPHQLSCFVSAVQRDLNALTDTVRRDAEADNPGDGE